jgi:putative transposase
MQKLCLLVSKDIQRLNLPIESFDDWIPEYTSINCSNCGHKVPKTLAVRIHRCDMCGVVFDRDYNAALNILQRGIELLCLLIPMGHRESTPVEIAPQQSLKQEEATEFIQG